MAAGPPRLFWGVLAMIEAAVMLLHLPSLRLPHVEGDEVIFTFLAERLGERPLAYHLRGALEGEAARRFVADTWQHLYLPPPGDPNREAAAHAFASLARAEVLRTPAGGPAYDPAIYDTPLFIHPPLYPWTLAVARRLFGPAGGPGLSILFHAATVALVAVLGRQWGGVRVGLVAAGLLAVDPVSWLCGSRLWIDGMAQAMVAAAVLAACAAARTGGPVPFALAGVVFGLACWTKLTAVLALPALVAVACLAPARPRARDVAAYVACAAGLLGLWLVVTRVGYGAWLPANRPTPWILEQSRYLKLAVGRPWHFYLSGLVLVAPVLAGAVPALARLRARPWLSIPLAWAGTTVVAQTLLAAAGLGGGFQLRYLAPGLPGLCLLAAAGLVDLGWWAVVPALVLGTFTFQAGYQSGAAPAVADPVPALLAQYLDQLGSGLSQIAPRMW